MPRSTEYFKGSLCDKMPPGVVWPRDPGTAQDVVLSDLAQEFARVDARIGDLIRESRPLEALELLADWEREAGLPDDCTPEGATVQERRALVRARMTLSRDDSKQFYLRLAAELGYEIDIEEFTLFRPGASKCGHVLGGGTDSRFQWRVTVLGTKIIKFMCGVSKCGHSLGLIRRAEELECLFRRMNDETGHTSLIFAYTDHLSVRGSWWMQTTDTAQALTPGQVWVGDHPVRALVITCEDNPIRYALGGSAPTQGANPLGHVLEAGRALRLTNQDNIRSVRIISRDPAAPGLLQITPETA